MKFKTMIPLAQYPFKGPYRSLREVENLPGVFAIISEFKGKNYLLDVDSSDEIKKAIKTHERKQCWHNHRKGTLIYAILYETDFPSESKEKIVKKMRKRYKTMPCGSSPS